ncbi:hypothetical protein KEM52_004273 [Ascosphaera acerosa]|nr:hypothetical protein KEM52_004273 [Ascosphaera acerosa]
MAVSDGEGSLSEAASPAHTVTRKRKTPHDGPSLEIDLAAPEPPSKKALRKLKKQQKADRKANKRATKEDDEGRRRKEDDQAERDEAEQLSEEGDSVTARTEEFKVAKKAQKLQGPVGKTASAATTTAPSNKRSPYGVWIGNLAFSTTADELRTFLVTHAEGLSPHNITRVHLPEGKRNAAGKPQNKGFAYVDFDKATCVAGAVALSESVFNGRRCLIKDAKNFEGRPDSRKDGGADETKKTTKPPSRKIFVGNLSFDVDKSMLEDHFGKCGSVSHVHVATFQDSGKCKGYAWVEFEDGSSAESAVKGFVRVAEESGADDEQAEQGIGNGGLSSSASPGTVDDSAAPAEQEAHAAGVARTAAKPTKRKQASSAMKKVWVNRLLGRPMRIEFAEDSETRYNKRFGKDTNTKSQLLGAASDAAITEVGVTGAGSQDGLTAERQRPNYNTTRYSEQTVQRLTGGIVEAQGKKISFD